jgi:hypothetical protein
MAITTSNSIKVKALRVNSVGVFLPISIFMSWSAKLTYFFNPACHMKWLHPRGQNTNSPILG